MPFCGNCGNRLSELAVACPKCGTLTPRGESHSDIPRLEHAYPNAPELRPMGVGEIIDAAITIYKKNFTTLLTLTAVVVVPVQVLSALIRASALTNTVGTFQTTPGTAPTFDASAVWTGIAAALVTAALNIVAGQLATAASLRTVSEAYLGEQPDWRESLQFAFRRLGSLIGAAFLIALLSGLGFLLCFVPGAWLAVSWSVAVPVLLFERTGAVTAMSRSFNLVKGRWWYVAAVYFLSQLVAGVLSFILGFVLGFALHAGSGGSAVGFVRSAIIGSVAGVLITPFLASTIAIMYFDLRVRKEGFDIELLAQRFGAMEPPPSLPPTPPPAPRPRPTAPRTPASDATDFTRDPRTGAPRPRRGVQEEDDDGEPEPVPSKPTARKPAPKKPAARKPAARKPAARKPAAPRTPAPPDDDESAKPRPGRRRPSDDPDDDPEFFHG